MSSIEKILSELYQLEPSLKDQEKDLIKIIDLMLKNKPKIEIDQTFITKLRQELINKPMKQSFSLKNLIPWSVAGLAIVVMMISNRSFLTENLKISNLIKDDFKVSKLDSNAFGKLDYPETNPPLGSPETLSARVGTAIPSASLELVSSMGVAEPALAPVVNIDKALMNSVMLPQSGGGLVADSKMAIWMPPVQYKYVYNGNIDLSNIDPTVFRRIYDKSGGFLLKNITGLNLPYLDLKKVNGGVLSNLSFSDNNGYITNLDFITNLASIYLDYNKKGWDYFTNPGEQFNLDNFPEDEKIISVASSMLNKYGVNLKNYGKPYIDKSWRGPAVLAQESGQIPYIPQDVNVKFPLAINNFNVYESYGGAYGLNVSVNLYRMTVTSINEIAGLDFESSKYEMTTDIDLVRKMMEKGGIDTWYYLDSPDTKLVELNVGDPELVYMRYFSWNQDANQNKELYVPALRFPILDLPKDYYNFNNRDAVIIPLVKEIIEKNIDNGGIRPLPVDIMPMVK